MGRQTPLQELACSRNKTRAFPPNPPICSKRRPKTARTDGERRSFQRAAGFPSKIHGDCSQAPRAPSWVRVHQARRYLGEHYASDTAHRIVSNWTFTNIIAGSDSVGAVITTMMFHLLQNSNSMQKLHTELRSANLTRPHARLSEIQSLPYLDACMWEAIRLHPAFALPFERVVPEGGITIGDIISLRARGLGVVRMWSIDTRKPSARTPSSGDRRGGWRVMRSTRTDCNKAL